MRVETKFNLPNLDRKWFELSPEGEIIEADWRMGSVFITGGMTESVTQHTFLIENKKDHRYCYAMTGKNARRIFHRRGDL